MSAQPCGFAKPVELTVGIPKSAFYDTVQLRPAAISHGVTPSKLFVSEQSAVVAAEALGVTVQEMSLLSATERPLTCHKDT